MDDDSCAQVLCQFGLPSAPVCSPAIGVAAPRPIYAGPHRGRGSGATLGTKPRTPISVAAPAAKGRNQGAATVTMKPGSGYHPRHRVPAQPQNLTLPDGVTTPKAELKSRRQNVQVKPRGTFDIPFVAASAGQKKTIRGAASLRRLHREPPASRSAPSNHHHARRESRNGSPGPPPHAFPCRRSTPPLARGSGIARSPRSSSTSTRFAPYADSRRALLPPLWRGWGPASTMPDPAWRRAQGAGL